MFKLLNYSTPPIKKRFSKLVKYAIMFISFSEWS